MQNAFNSVPWRNILNAMETKEIPSYFCQLVDKYLSNRTFHFHFSGVKEYTINLTSGVPQGSVLRPTLWNIFYDDLLRAVLPRSIRYLDFADDIAIFAQAKDTWHLETALKAVAEKTKKWLQNSGLSWSFTNRKL